MPGGGKWKSYRASVKDCRICSLNTRCINSKKDMSERSKGKELMIMIGNEDRSFCVAMREKLNTQEYG
jgi:hypothetical protein